MKVEQNLRKDFWNWKDFTSKNSLVCIKETRNRARGKIMKKKVIISTLLITMNICSVSNAQILDQTVYNIPLSSSITLKKVQEHYGNSYNSFNMLEVDLNNPNNSIDVLFNTTGLYKTMSISNTANSTPNLVGAVNADFFLLQGFTSSIGAIVKNGKVLSSPAENYGKYASMIVTNDNKVSFEYINPYVVLRNETQNKDYFVPAMNKVISDSYNGITIRTSDYSYTTLGKNDKNKNRVEIIVGSDNIVKEVRVGQTYTQIPYGGFAIISCNIDDKELPNKFKVGDKLNVSLDIILNRGNIKTIIGGGSILVKNGEKTPITSKIPGKAQRTAAAITKDNKLVLFTNDGRLSSSAGLDEKDLQNYFHSLGYKDAMIFDGGGSTQMVVDGKTQNQQYGERKVINAIAVKNEKQKGDVAKVNVTPLKEIIYVGDNVEVVASAQDSAGSKVTKYNTNNFSLATSGFNSNVSARFITPTTAGTGTITASVQGVSGSANVTVLPAHQVDDKQKQDTKGTKKFNIFSNMDDGSDLISTVIKSKISSLTTGNDNNLIIGNSDESFSKNISGNSQNINNFTPNKVLGNTTVISVNNTVNISNNPAQWNNIKIALESGSKNVILAMLGGNSINSSSEQHLFDKMLEKYAKNKNIYVIYKGGNNDGYKRGNVSYIGIVDLSKQNYSDLSNVKYLEMYEDENQNIVYKFKNII